MRITIRPILAVLAGVTLVAGVCYHLGRRDGSASARAAARDVALRANAAELARSRAEDRRATRRKVDRRCEGATPRGASTRRRDRVSTLWIQRRYRSTAARCCSCRRRSFRRSRAGHARGATRSPSSTRAWGQLWKDKAQLLETRVGLLEGQIDDERASHRRAELKTAAISALLGALGAVLLGH
jgi:hypothetical protein